MSALGGCALLACLGASASLGASACSPVCCSGGTKGIAQAGLWPKPQT